MNVLRARIEQGVARLLRLRRAFDVRARRERFLLIGAAVAVAVMAADQLWLTPAFSAWQTASRREASAAEALQSLNNTIAQHGMESRALEQQLQRDLTAWRSKVQQGDAELRAFGTSLVPAADMLPVLDRMLAQAGGLRLRSMQSLARTELATAPASAAAPPPAAAASGSAAAAPAPAPALYRHGVELTVEGTYADLLDYLNALEAMPQRLLWGGVQMKVDQYPKSVLTLRLYTLSMDRGWLEI
jgi:MSHA biogenesis protein MshJ